MELLCIGHKPTDLWDKKMEQAEVTLQMATEVDYLSFLTGYEFRMILVNLGSLPGLATIKMIRSLKYSTPCVMISDEMSGYFKADALDHGFDDIVNDATCSVEEFLARVRAIVRRYSGFVQSILVHGPITLDLRRHRCEVLGKDVVLSRLEFRLFKILLLHRDTIMSKNRLIDLLYGADLDAPDTRAMDVVIFRLRDRLRAVGAYGVIETVWGYGVRLISVDDSRFMVKPTGLQRPHPFV